MQKCHVGARLRVDLMIVAGNMLFGVLAIASKNAALEKVVDLYVKKDRHD